MRKNKLLVILLPISLLTFCCDKVNSSDGKEKPNELGGDTNISINTVGNTITNFGVAVGDTAYDLDQSITVVSTDNGITTINVKADLSKSPELQNLFELMPDKYKDNNGKLDADLDFKFTSEGIQDFTNRDHGAHTIVKYESNVGDQYNFTKSNGQTISRTVTAKSTTDDYPWGLMLIKVIKVEQDSRIPGVRKIIYYANHRFGLVGMELLMEDGTLASTTFYD